MKNAIELPNGHEVLFQDDEMVISFEPSHFNGPADDEEEDGERDDIKGTVYFWFFDDAEHSVKDCLRWNDCEDRSILLQETETPGESAACLSVLTNWNEEQNLIVSSKAAQLLATRFNRRLKAVRYPLKDDQEILFEDEDIFAILTKKEATFCSSPQTWSFLQIISKKQPDTGPLVWLDEKDQMIETRNESHSEFALITVNGPNVDPQKIRIPLELGRNLAQQFGKKIVNRNVTTEKTPANDSTDTGDVSSYPPTSKSLTHIASESRPDEPIIPFYSVYCKKPSLKRMTIEALVSIPIFYILASIGAFLLTIIVSTIIARNVTKYRCITILERAKDTPIPVLYLKANGAALLIVAAFGLAAGMLPTLIRDIDMGASTMISAFLLVTLPFSLLFTVLLPIRIKQQVESGRAFQSQ